MGYPAERTIVHSIGVDVERFKPPTFRRREEIVLFVGRLVEKKGCGNLIEAMAEVQRRRPAAELVVIGGGPLRVDYEARAAALRVRCRFLGHQPTAVVREWMARAIGLLCAQRGCSLRRRGGLRHGVYRGAGDGLPVVSTGAAGIPEAVKDGETGLLVTERDPGALAEAILELMQNDELWRRYSLAGRTRVVDNFNLVAANRAARKRFRAAAGRPGSARLKGWRDGAID